MAEPEISTRGTFQFQADPQEGLFNLAANVQALRRLWLDRKWVNGEAIGPGDPGDFDYGAWHVACHLVAAGGVRRASDGRLLWLEISHEPSRDEYFASLTRKRPSGIETLPLDSAEGLEALADSELLGFVEGNSTGRTSALRLRLADGLQPLAASGFRSAGDQRCRRRQGLGALVHAAHIRETSRIGTAVLTAYVSLAAALGDRFPAAVARGRRDYGHPWQLCAMVQAGFVSEQAATWETKPAVIPAADDVPRRAAADPGVAVEVCEKLDWSGGPRYYMFKRRVERWSETEAVRRDLQEFRKSVKE